MSPTVLLIDDDVELGQLLGRLFQREHLHMCHALSIAQGQAMVDRAQPAVVILDLMLPDGHGLDMCRQLRATAPLLPILILTARGDPMDRVLGLELGADDYLPKPFEARELLARVRALLRRQQAAASAGAPPVVQTTLTQGELTLDMTRLQASWQDQVLPLTASEFRLLAALARRPGQPLDREALASAVQPGQYRPLERAIDVQIARLRRKLREGGADCIRTVRGAGYTLVTPPDDTPA
jgi:DNA-binding response OmpR family regulator